MVNPSKLEQIKREREWWKELHAFAFKLYANSLFWSFLFGPLMDSSPNVGSMGKWVCVWVSQTLCEHAFKSFTSHNQSIYRSIYMHNMYVFYYVCMVIYLKIPQCVRIHNFLKFIGWLSIIHSGNTHTHPMRNWAYYGSLVECTRKTLTAISLEN